LKQNAINRLLKGYPSHNCIIDRQEAKRELFNHVRVPSPEELALLTLLQSDATDALPEEEAYIYVLSQKEEIVEEPQSGANHENEKQRLEAAGIAAEGDGAIPEPGVQGASKNGTRASAKGSAGAK
jgi:hypothetical protein